MAWVGERVQAYASLLNAELGSVARAWQRRALWQVLALGSLVVGLALSGVAMMLWAVTPTLQPAALWMLWLVPSVPLVLAAICLWAAAAAGHRSPDAPMSLLAEQCARAYGPSRRSRSRSSGSSACSTTAR